MSGFWHAIWPGWDAVAGQVFVGIITLPIMVTGQIICMRLIARLRKHVAELIALNDALVAKNRALHVEALAAGHERLAEEQAQTRAERQAIRDRKRPDSFQGW